MDGSDKPNSLSSPSKLSASPKSSKSDGNHQNYLPSVTNLLNPRKPREMEKIAKKKVLTERNEASYLMSCEFPEIPNFDPKPSSSKVSPGSSDNSLSQTSPISSRVSDFDGNEENSLAADLSSRPYDPLTNYLSPRPKFLRYKPNRRREIFLRRENNRAGEGNSAFEHSLDSQKTVREDALWVSPASSLEEENARMQKEENLEEIEGEFNEIDAELEDEGEREEDRGWTVKELLKFLLITASLVLSTSYITSMNTSKPSFEVSGAFGPGFCPILNHTDELSLDLVMEPASRSNFWDEDVTEATSKMNLGGRQFVHQEDRENMAFMEESDVWNGEYEDKAEHGHLVEEEVEYTEQVKETAEKPQAGEGSAQEMAAGEKNEAELLELTVEDDGDQGKGEENEIFVTIAVISEIPEKHESIETPKPYGFDQDNLVSDISTASVNEYKEAVEMVEAGDRKMVESNIDEAENFVYESSKITKRIYDGRSIFGEITNLKELEKLKSELIKLMHTESLLKVVAGLSASSVILTCLVLSFQFKKKKYDGKEPAVSVSVKPLLESPVMEAEKIIARESPRIKPTFDTSSCERIENVDSFKMLSSSIHSRDEAENFKEFYHSEAPIVQFLGEFEIGEVTSSLMNKTGLENKMIEAEDSSFSVSVEKKQVSKMHSGPSTKDQALSEFSTMNSPSYGSFTTEKKIVKKEVGGDGEVKLTPTPVRRSTRIRNRIVSP